MKVYRQPLYAVLLLLGMTFSVFQPRLVVAEEAQLAKVSAQAPIDVITTIQ